MKKTIFLPLIFILTLSLQAQSSYKVIKVNGKIQYVRTGSDMALGDEFKEDESLSFGSPTARAAVINPGKGRFILTPESAGQLSGAKTNFLPARSNISTRGGMLNSLKDLEKMFSEAISIIYEASWYINPYQFPMDENRFFFIQYQNNGEQINRKLPFNEQNLVFSRKEILKVHDQAIESLDAPHVVLYYNGKEGPLFISDFDLVFPEMELLKAEAGIILEEFRQKEYSEKVNEISGYLYEFYGKPDREDVMLFLETDFGLSK